MYELQRGIPALVPWSQPRELHTGFHTPTWRKYLAIMFWSAQGTRGAQTSPLLWVMFSESLHCQEFNIRMSVARQWNRKTAALGTWVAQLVKRLTSAQVMFARSVSWSPASGSVLTAQPGACFRFCVSLSLCPFPAHTHTLSLSLSRACALSTINSKLVFKTSSLFKKNL